MDSWSCPDDENISSHFALSWSCRVVANAKLPYCYWYRHVFIGVSPETSLAASLTTIKNSVSRIDGLISISFSLILSRIQCRALLYKHFYTCTFAYVCCQPLQNLSKFVGQFYNRILVPLIITAAFIFAILLLV